MSVRALVGARPSLHVGGRYSRRVDRLRFVLPMIAGLLLAIVMVWPWLAGGYNGLIVPVFKSAADHAGDVMRMSKPRYVGRTEQSDAYEVTASSAFLDPADPDRIHLDHLQAVFEQTGDSPIHLRADEGVYQRERQWLELDGNLELLFGDGYQFETESADIDLERGHVTGTEPVRGEGPLGTLAADRFDIEDGGSRLRFEGRVHVTVMPSERGL